MGISAFGASGLKPGVCTSTTRPSAPYEGMMIYETDTNKLLVYGGSSWIEIVDLDVPPAMTFITSATAGGTSTSLSVNDCFTSSFVNYYVQWNGLGATNDQSFNLRLRTSGTDTSTGTVYRRTTQQQYVGIAAVAVTGSNGANEINIGSISNAEGYYHLYISQPQVAKATLVHSEGINNQAAFSNGIDAYRCQGFVNNTTQYDGFTLFSGAGNLTGTVRVYGYRSS